MSRPRRISDPDILDAVRAEIRSNGAGFSLRAVAERLKISQPALFQRFGSRRELVLAALRPCVAGDGEPAAFPAVDDRPLAAQLADLLRCVAGRLGEAVPGLIALREAGLGDWAGEGAAEASPGRLCRGLVDWLEAARARGLISGRPTQETAVAMVSSVCGYLMLERALPCAPLTGGLEAHVASLGALFARALGPAGGAP